ncbi:hypothetical protein PQI23_13670 [Leucobacter sp. USCH14]|uniref:hypothetical protein n=1 Tax=Leucobacter sp. USCH14 TaxID=3024838 RepID=UPI0030A80CFF
MTAYAPLTETDLNALARMGLPRTSLDLSKENSTMTDQKQIPPGSIAAFAKAQGIDLLPWQVEAARAIESGEIAKVMPSAKRAGKTTFKRLVDDCYKALGINENGDPR